MKTNEWEERRYEPFGRSLHTVEGWCRCGHEHIPYPPYSYDASKDWWYDQVNAVIKAPDGWVIYSVKPYCGSSECLVVEFVDGHGDCKTFYGSVLSIQRQVEESLPW